MPFRLCPTCGTFIEIGERWEAHYQSHKGRKPNGRYGSTRQWRNIRERVLERDEYQCTVHTSEPLGAYREAVRCPETAFLEIHHLDGNHRNNQLDNLVTLCKDHHRQATAAQRKAA